MLSAVCHSHNIKSLTGKDRRQIRAPWGPAHFSSSPEARVRGAVVLQAGWGDGHDVFNVVPGKQTRDLRHAGAQNRATVFRDCQYIGLVGSYRGSRRVSKIININDEISCPSHFKMHSILIYMHCYCHGHTFLCSFYVIWHHSTGILTILAFVLYVRSITKASILPVKYFWNLDSSWPLRWQSTMEGGASPPTANKKGHAASSWFMSLHAVRKPKPRGQAACRSLADGPSWAHLSRQHSLDTRNVHKEASRWFRPPGRRQPVSGLPSCNPRRRGKRQAILIVICLNSWPK